jgi:hypothetical protein
MFQQQQLQQQAQQPHHQQRAAYDPSNQYQQHADATNHLAHQLSNQNLGGGNPYAGSGFPMPREYQQTNQHRPRTAGATGGQSYNSGFLAPGMRSYSQEAYNMKPLGERNPHQFQASSRKMSFQAQEAVTGFFKNAVDHARERNQR